MFLATTVVFSLVALSAPRRHIDIPAGAARITLAEWSAQAVDLQVLYVAEKFSGYRTRAVRCFCAPVVALAQMVEGTPIIVVGDEVENEPSDYTPADPVITLSFNYPTCKPHKGANAPLPPCRKTPATIRDPPWRVQSLFQRNTLTTR